ncbi:hypothetical protein FRB98_000719 [Tulasnella sp. 332]|nr:hypothetical protein FRB98_000719 [Tulasnella sp. 332]
MAIGMFIHRLHPKTVAPRFVKSIPSTVSGIPGWIRLVFYTPSNYGNGGGKGRTYPVIVNFHGGGFTIGSATDDARWATAVVQLADTVVCSVDYRLAPEHPHPTAVEDGTDAVLYLYEHADELRIDRERIGISGFSAGGNLAITVPMRLQDIRQRRNTNEGYWNPSVSLDDTGSISKKQRHRDEETPIVKIVVAWYPKTDFSRVPLPTQWPDKELPWFFVKLFDAAYLHSFDAARPINLYSPYLSPAVASDEQLRSALPRNVLLYTTEYDSLYAEGERLRERLKGLNGAIDVQGKMISNKKHGWDRSPNVFQEDLVAQEVYAEACAEIRRVFYDDPRGLLASGSTRKPPLKSKDVVDENINLIDLA